jgi:hypothetical protein
MKFILAVRK